MAKKLILIGPPGVGKTTIKQIVFEDQNSNDLLQNSLEPTLGNELTVVDLESAQLAINDLAGQEIDRWIENEPEVFNDSDAVLIFLDASLDWEKHLEFLNRLFDILQKGAPDAKIIVLFHKTDLIPPHIQDQLMYQVIQFQRASPLAFEFHFTSIVGQYFPRFLDFFFEFMFSLYVPDEVQAHLIQNSLHRIYLILNALTQNRSMDENYLLIDTGLTPDIFAPICKILILQQFITEIVTKSGKNIILLEQGQAFFEFLSLYFAPSSLPVVDKASKRKKKPMPPNRVAGVLISDEIGQVMCLVEARTNEIVNLLQTEGAQNDSITNFASLIFSAIFSSGVSFEFSDIPELLLKGKVLNYYLYRIKPFYFIFFVNPAENMMEFKDSLKNIPQGVVEQFQEVFTAFSENAAISPRLNELKALLRTRILQINGLVTQDPSQLEFDAIKARELFLLLDIQTHNPDLQLTQVKKLRRELLTAVLSKNVSELQELETKIRDLELTKSENEME